MFQDFSFDSPRSPSLDSTNTTTSTRDTSRSVSPCSAASAYPPPPFSVTDLAVQFSAQRLRKDSQICYHPCESYACQDDDAGWQIDSVKDSNGHDALRRSQTTQSSIRAHSPSRRLQRQISTRLLCTGAHHRDIASLVAGMVQAQNQCNIHHPSSYCPNDETCQGSSRPSSAAVSRPKLDYRRASDLRTSTGCINKAIRCRKDRAHTRKRSGEER